MAGMQLYICMQATALAPAKTQMLQSMLLDCWGKKLKNQTKISTLFAFNLIQ